LPIDSSIGRNHEYCPSAVVSDGKLRIYSSIAVSSTGPDNSAEKNEPPIVLASSSVSAVGLRWSTL
jgi:hypothetical protein